MTIKKITIICILVSFVAGFSFLNSASSKVNSYKFHTEHEIKALKDSMSRAPIAAGEFFLPSSSCRGCHGYDSAGLANINEGGEDINLVDRWESSMMALSAKDPLWRAKVSQEILVNPGHSLELQNKCTSCHAPMGHYTSKYHGNAHYTMSDLANDTLGLDGVSCGGCHMIGPDVGFTFSGSIPYDTNGHVEYGPFPAPFTGPMELYEGFTPVFSMHMDESRVCSSCHTLITQTADLSGNLTGGEFVEQATYHEYLNSDFPANNITCQGCHMPKLVDPIIIANGASGLTPRYPFNQHKFAGANLFMLKLIKANRDSLYIDVPYKSFDSTIVATADMLQNQTLNVDLTLDSSSVDTAFFSVKLENKAGHKFPSGYPARRAIVQFIVTDASNDTVFRSGTFDSDYRVIGENPSFEGHHNYIRQQNVPQIYELVMGDVNSNFTSVLERAAVILKDNRLPPVGFSSSHASYDTVKISADAMADFDFNKTGAVEGSGIDQLHFNVARAGISGNLKIRAKVFYQSVPPKWVDEMFAMSSPEINKFKTMYQNADHSPVLVGADSLVNVFLPTSAGGYAREEIKVWPSVSQDGQVNVSTEYGELIRSVQVIGSDGKLYSQSANSAFGRQLSLELPSAAGVYYLRIYTNRKVYLKKVVKT
jgi:hypothetical protein